MAGRVPMYFPTSSTAASRTAGELSSSRLSIARRTRSWKKMAGSWATIRPMARIALPRNVTEGDAAVAMTRSRKKSKDERRPWHAETVSR